MKTSTNTTTSTNTGPSGTSTATTTAVTLEDDHHVEGQTSITLVSAFGDVDEEDQPTSTRRSSANSSTKEVASDNNKVETTPLLVQGIPSSAENNSVEHPPAIDVNGIIIAESSESGKNNNTTSNSSIIARTPSHDDSEQLFLRTVDSYSSLTQLASDTNTTSNTTSSNNNNTSNNMSSNPKAGAHNHNNRSRTNTSDSFEDNSSSHSLSSTNTSTTTPAVIIPRDFTYGRGINQHYQDPTIPPRYELKVHIIRGNVAGGGLGNAAHVEVFIDDLLIHRTENSPTSPYVWNETVKFSFHDMEGPQAPVMVALSLYKKRWTSSGFKLVGTSQIPLKDLSDKILDKQGIIDKEYPLNFNRHNVTLTGALFLGFQLKTINPSDKVIHHCTTTNANVIIPKKSGFATNISLLDGGSGGERKSDLVRSSVAEDGLTESDRMSMRDSAVQRYQKSKGTASVRFSSIVSEEELKTLSTVDNNTSTSYKQDVTNNAEDIILADSLDSVTTGNSSSTSNSTNHSNHKPHELTHSSLGNSGLEEKVVMLIVLIIAVLFVLNLRQYNSTQRQLTAMHSQVDSLIKHIGNIQQCSFK